MIFELDERRKGDWDQFQIRKIGFKAQKESLGRLDEKPRREIIKLGTAD
jgi:hypothetical protein